MKATENGMEEVFPPFYIFLDVKARNLVLPGEILQCYGIPLNFHVIRLQGFIIWELVPSIQNQKRGHLAYGKIVMYMCDISHFVSALVC